MINKKFEAYKIKREITRSGMQYTALRKGTNDFGEFLDESEIICSFCGLYHEQNSFIKITVETTTQIRNKKEPKILCLFEDVKELKLGDIIQINNKIFKVSSITNIQEWSIIADISLEEEVEDVTEN